MTKTITIDDHKGIPREYLAEPWQGQRHCITMQRTDSDERLFTRVDPEFCSCRDYRFRGKERPCKHIAYLKSTLEETTMTDPPTENLPAVQDAEVVPATTTPTNGQLTLPSRPGGLPHLARALVKAQKACRAVVKNSYNSYHKYAYANAEDIIAEGQETLSAAGISFCPESWRVNGFQKDGQDRYELIRVCSLTEEQSGEEKILTCAWPIVVEKGRPLDKATAIAFTSSLEYILRDILLMPRVNSENDMNARDDRPAPPPQQRPNPPPTPAAATPPANPLPSPDALINDAQYAELVNLLRIGEDDPQSVAKQICNSFAIPTLKRLPAMHFDHVQIRLWNTCQLAARSNQLNDLDDLARELAIPNDVYFARMKTLYGTDDPTQLTRMQAADLIGKLQEKKKAKAVPA